MAKKRKLALFRGDRSLWIIIAVLCVVSLLVVYSATVSMAYREVGGDTSYFLFRQARFIVFGFFMIVVVHWIDYRSYARYARVLFQVSIIFVILAYVIGVNLNDAARWIKIPIIGLTFQPSDMLKITLVMVLAQQLGSRQGIIDRIPVLPSLTNAGWQRNPQKNLDIFIKTTKPLIMPIVIACAVVLPANLSTAIIIFTVCMVMLWMGRVRHKELWRLMMTAGAALALVVSVMFVTGVGRAGVWISRVESFISPVFSNDADTTAKDKNNKQKADDFQIEQARIAIASGGVVGKGPGNSTQRSQLPHPYSDFAYAFILEEYGIIGGAIVFVLYLWIFYRAGVIVRRCKRPSPGLLVLGLSLIITMQAFVNMCVSVGLIPVTGQTLPLISLGGSSVFFTCISFGMILGVSRESDAEEAAMQKEIEEQLKMEAAIAAGEIIPPTQEQQEQESDADDDEYDYEEQQEDSDGEYYDPQELESEEAYEEPPLITRPPIQKSRPVAKPQPEEQYEEEFTVSDYSNKNETEDDKPKDKKVVSLYDDE